MSYIILAILFILSGFFMKYSDDLFDVDDNLAFASVFGVFCGFKFKAHTLNALARWFAAAW